MLAHALRQHGALMTWQCCDYGSASPWPRAGRTEALVVAGGRRLVSSMRHHLLAHARRNVICRRAHARRASLQREVHCARRRVACVASLLRLKCRRGQRLRSSLSSRHLRAADAQRAAAGLSQARGALDAARKAARASSGARALPLKKTPPFPMLQSPPSAPAGARARCAVRGARCAGRGAHAAGATSRPATLPLPRFGPAALPRRARRGDSCRAAGAHHASQRSRGARQSGRRVPRTWAVSARCLR